MINPLLSQHGFRLRGVQADLALIPAGMEPLGRYEITYDFYMMTTEVTDQMWESVNGNGTGGSMMAHDYMSWYAAAEYANAVSLLAGKEQCYDCSEIPWLFCTEAIDPRLCNGYRLPTRAEWEYAQKSGSTEEFYTGEGPNLGGYVDEPTGCQGTERIIDGVNNPLLSDYA